MFPRLCAAKAQKGRGALTSPPDNAWNLLPCVGADAFVRPRCTALSKPAIATPARRLVLQSVIPRAPHPPTVSP